jgi:thioesterase domain-containing protein
MGWYADLGVRWPIEPIRAPTLLVRAESPMSDGLADADWKPTWPTRHEAIDVPGDHYSMLQEHADSTALAVERWLKNVIP